MAAINFPNSPTVGDTFTASDKTWVYLDGKWTLQPVETQFPVTISSATSGSYKVTTITAGSGNVSWA